MNSHEQPSIIGKVSTWYKGLPDKKRYAEFITAFLSIPVLLTVIISNVTSLRSPTNQSPQPTVTERITYVPVEVPKEPTEIVTPENSPTTSPICKKEVGPVDISYPHEGDTISENPVTMVITYQVGEYCAAVWSYRINSGSWSQFDDKSISLYDMPAGEKNFELRVKSIASGQEVLLQRSFIYSPEIEDNPSPTATVSASLREETRS